MFFTGESRRKLLIFSLALAQGLRVGDKVRQGVCALAMLLHIESFYHFEIRNHTLFERLAGKLRCELLTQTECLFSREKLPTSEIYIIERAAACNRTQ